MAEGAIEQQPKQGPISYGPTVEIKIEPNPKEEVAAVSTTRYSEKARSAFLTALRATKPLPFEPSKRAYVAEELSKSIQVLIGLDQLVEISFHKPTYEPGYYCNVCVEVFSADKVIDHLTSTPHRSAFLIQVARFVGLSSLLKALEDPTAVEQAVSKAAALYERTHGRGSIRHIFAKSFDQRLLSLRIIPPARLGDLTIQCSSTIPRAYFCVGSDTEQISAERRQTAMEQEVQARFTRELATAPTRRFKFKKEQCSFHDELAKFPQPLVGLEQIIEIRSSEKEFGPGHFCRCCEVIIRGTFDGLTRHVKSMRHTKLYLDSVKPLSDDVQALLDNASLSALFADFTAAAKCFEDSYGREAVTWRFVGEFDNELLKTPRIGGPKGLSLSERLAIGAIETDRAKRARKNAKKKERKAKARAAKQADPSGIEPSAVNFVSVGSSEPRKEDNATKSKSSLDQVGQAPKKKSAPVGPIASDYFDLQGNIAISPNLTRPLSTPARPPTLPPPSVGLPPNFVRFYGSPYGMPLGPGPSWGPGPPYGVTGPPMVPPSFSAPVGPHGPDFSTAQLLSWPGWNLGPSGPGLGIAGPLPRGTVFGGPATGNPEWFTGVLTACPAEPGSELGGTAGSKDPGSELGVAAGTSAGSVDGLKASAGDAWHQLRYIMAGQRPELCLPPDPLPDEPVCSDADVPIKRELKDEPLSEDERSDISSDSASSASSEQEDVEDRGNDYADWAAYNEWLCKQPQKTEATITSLTEATMSSSQTSAATPKNDDAAIERYETLAKRARLTAFALSNFDTLSSPSNNCNSIATSSISPHYLNSSSLKSRDISPAAQDSFQLFQQGRTHEASADKGLDQFMALLNSFQGGSMSDSGGEGLRGLLGPSGSGPAFSGGIGSGPSLPGPNEGSHFSSNRPIQSVMNTASIKTGSIAAKLSRNDLLGMLLEEKQRVAEQEQVIKSLAKRIGS